MCRKKLRSDGGKAQGYDGTVVLRDELPYDFRIHYERPWNCLNESRSLRLRRTEQRRWINASRESSQEVGGHNYACGVAVAKHYPAELELLRPVN